MTLTNNHRLIALNAVSTMLAATIAVWAHRQNEPNAIVGSVIFFVVALALLLWSIERGYN